MPVVTMRELLEAGVHFGHQTRRWNPKMRRFIFGERDGIYLIDLQQTLWLLDEAAQFTREIASRGGTVLFVGTKKQARESVASEAARVGMPYVNQRWLGGLLTNFKTMADRIAYLHDLRRQSTEGQLGLLPTKERISKLSDLEKLETNIGGVADMRRVPHAMVVVDMKVEALAVREARRLNIPVIGLVDTNCDPDDADYVVPGNDDAIKSCALVCRVIANAIAEGRAAGGLPIGKPDDDQTGDGEADAAEAETAAVATAVAADEESEAAVPVAADEVAATEEPAADTAEAPAPADAADVAPAAEAASEAEEGQS